MFPPLVIMYPSKIGLFNGQMSHNVTTRMNLLNDFLLLICVFVFVLVLVFGSYTVDYGFITFD